MYICDQVVENAMWKFQHVYLQIVKTALLTG